MGFFYNKLTIKRGEKMHSELCKLIFDLMAEASKDWSSEAWDIYDKIDELLNDIEKSGVRY